MVDENLNITAQHDVESAATKEYPICWFRDINDKEARDVNIELRCAFIEGAEYQARKDAQKIFTEVDMKKAFNGGIEMEKIYADKYENFAEWLTLYKQSKQK